MVIEYCVAEPFVGDGFDLLLRNAHCIGDLHVLLQFLFTTVEIGRGEDHQFAFKRRGREHFFAKLFTINIAC